MAWIHGGGLIVGSRAWSAYDGSRFAKNRDVVLVSINYRLFDKAIIQSGGRQIVSDEQFGFETGRLLSKRFECDKQPDELACLRSRTDREQLRSWAPLSQKVGWGKALHIHNPHIDGYVLQDYPLNSLRQGKFNNVPLLAGSNRNEERVITGFSPNFLIPQAVIREFTKLFIAEPMMRSGLHPNTRKMCSITSLIMINTGWEDSLVRVMEWSWDLYSMRWTAPRSSFCTVDIFAAKRSLWRKP